MYFENIFKDPDSVRKQIHKMDMVDYMAEDGVVYPGIVDLTDTEIARVVYSRFLEIWPKFSPTKIFARYSFEQMKPPNWAHSDRDMTQMVALIYLPDKRKPGKTYLLEHETGMREHPKTLMGKKMLLDDSNDTFKWEVTQTLEGRQNSCWIMNADYIHAAGVSYGREKQSARLVITCFFDIDKEKIDD